MRRNFQTFLFLSILGLAPKLEAVSDSEVFLRCYSHLTGTRPAFNHSLWSQVRSGSLSAVDACMTVFERAFLNGSGITVGEASGDPQQLQEARNVLRTFYNFHKTWFPNDNFKESLNLSDVLGQHDVYDHSEAANYVSWLLFTPDSEYRDLLRGKRSVRAIREGQPMNGRILNRPKSHFLHDFRRPSPPEFPCDTGLAGGEDDYINCAPPAELNPLFLETGVLRGFRTLTSGEMDQFAILARTGGANFNQRLQTKFMEPKGGGAMGTPSYLLLNLGAGYGQGGFLRFNGGNRVGRRWSKAVYENFMCRTIPVITTSDAAPYVRPNGTHSWQNQQGCMSCHASIDGMAGVVRNFSVHSPLSMSGPPPGVTGDNYIEQVYIGTHPSTLTDATARIYTTSTDYLAQEPDLFGISNDADFFRRPPKGRFLYRDYLGTLYSEDIMGLDALGERLTTIDDFYLCAASRYYGFLTGFKPPVLDVPTSSEAEIAARSEMIELAQELKSTQNLKLLIRRILESPRYQEGLDP